MEKNILFYLTPKSLVKYLESDDNLRQAMEKMEFHNYSTIPVLSKDGRYLRSVSDQDILRYIKRYSLNLSACENTNIMKIDDVRPIKAIHIDKSIRDIYEIIIEQNFVPVLDDTEKFIGIVTRKTVISCLINERQGLK